MALQFYPGFTGLAVGRISSNDRRTIGKFTDSNALESFHRSNPTDYDKQVISLYTQSSLYSNDFQQMLDGTSPFLIDGMSDAWTWDIEVPYRFPKIIDVPASTTSQTSPGLDGKAVEVVLDIRLSVNTIFAIGSRMHGQQFAVISDGVPYNRAWLHQVVLLSANPYAESVNMQYFVPGVEIELDMGGALGEFDSKYPGLGKLAEKLSMYETLGSEYGKQHSITGWADDKRVMGNDDKGNPLDIIYYSQVRNGKVVDWKGGVKWEPFIEFLLRKEMLATKTNKHFWGQPGYLQSFGSQQELKKVSAGIYPRMRHSGNYVPYNRGELSVNLFRTVFGDLFYRRVAMKDRKVKLYTNEAGIAAFRDAIKNSALSDGLQFNVGSSDKFIQGSGQNLVLNYAFESFITQETGSVQVIHLQELDLQQTNTEFGQNKKSTPVFFVFDVSPTSGGSLLNNVREVRRANRPNMIWGYIDGVRHHLGAYASQGHSAANMDDKYTIFMKDRCDIFIEDLSRTVLIEEIPYI